MQFIVLKILFCDCQRKTIHNIESCPVKYFGAVGDGITDDTEVIQEAINSGVGQIFFPGTKDNYSY